MVQAREKKGWFKKGGKGGKVAKIPLNSILIHLF